MVYETQEIRHLLPADQLKVVLQADPKVLERAFTDNCPALINSKKLIYDSHLLLRQTASRFQLLAVGVYAVG